MLEPVPVTIIAGFLGAGKTTLLSRLLREAKDVRYGVLVNDFAAINIDAALIRDAGPDRIELTNGCVCCTIRDDLLAAAIALIAGANPLPDHILIECSGVADPRAVAIALTGELAGAAFRIDAIISLVDADNVVDLDFDATERVIDQAAASDLVLINKCDIAKPVHVDDIERMLLEAQPSMRLIRTSRAVVPLGLIVANRLDVHSGGTRCARHLDCGNPNHDHRHDHGGDFASRSWQTDRALPLDAFEAAVSAVPASVYRAKGILYFDGHPGLRAVFQLVGKRSELTFEPSEHGIATSALVAIGRAEAIDCRAFDSLFQPPGARLTRQA